jgi:hypothetical protein
MFRLLVAGLMIAMGMFALYEGILRPYLELRGLKRRLRMKRASPAFHTLWALAGLTGGLLVLYGPR